MVPNITANVTTNVTELTTYFIYTNMTKIGKN